MTSRPVVLRDAARADIEAALAHRLQEAGTDAALVLIDRLEKALTHISRHPESGSPRFAHELELPGLRCWPVEGEEYLVFYRPQRSDVDVWRVLHTRRNVPAWLRSDP